MALIEQTNRTLLGISGGKITRKVAGSDTPKTYVAIEGRLMSITRRNAVIKNVNTEFLDFLIEDGDQQYDLSVQTSGSAARGIILCLANVQNFVGVRIKINPYLSKDGQHTNIAVYVDGQKVSWVTTDIPKVEEKVFGSQVVKDDTKRMAVINGFIEQVQHRLLAAQATPSAAVQPEPEGDLPGDDDGWMNGEETM